MILSIVWSSDPVSNKYSVSTEQWVIPRKSAFDISGQVLLHVALRDDDNVVIELLVLYLLWSGGYSNEHEVNFS